MEQNFQTSFIPKKPIVEATTKSSKPVGVLLVISIFVFLSVLIGYGGVYFYKGILEKNVTLKQSDLKKAEGRFEVEKIKLLKNLDRKLVASNEVLNNHISVAPIFRELQNITIKTVRYTKFSYDVGPDKKVNVKLSGSGVGYRSMALQSDLFSQNKYFIDPVFYNLVLDEKGNVLFELSFTVDYALIDFKNTINVAGSSIISEPKELGGITEPSQDKMEIKTTN